MGIPPDLLALYKGLSPKERFYIRARWLVSPMDIIERAVPPRGRICDIGCGVGLLSNMMSLRSVDRDVVGFDLSAEKIRIAGRSIAGRKNIAFEQGDVTRADLGRPDAVTACDLMHHIPYPGQERLLAAIHRSLGPGGLFVLQDIDKAIAHKYLFALAVDLVLGKMAPVYYRRSGEWVRVLEKAGFEVSAGRIDKGYPIAAVLFRCIKKSG